MRIPWAILMAAVVFSTSAQAGPHDWLRHAAGSLGHDRCADMLTSIAREGMAGRPVGKNLEGARQLPDKQFLGGFVAALNGAQMRHHTFSVGENQKFMCEGRQVTSYVESGSCDRFVGQYLEDAEYLGDMADGRTLVYQNSPYQLYLSTLENKQGCLVTGIRRFGGVDPRSDCAWRDLRGGATELCMLFRAGRAPLLTLKLDDEPVLTLREDMTGDFRLQHPAPGGDGKDVEIAGSCTAERRQGRLMARVCDLSWAGEKLYDGVRLGLEP